MPGVRALSPELQAKAERELHEDLTRRDADIAHIRDWLKKQPHIKANNPSDQMLITFLRGCKYSLERTKEKLDMYFTIRSAVPEFFKDRDAKNKTVRELLKLGLYLPLPGVDDEGRRVFMIRPGVTDPSKHKIDEQFKLNFMLTDIMLQEDDDLIVSGMISVIDLDKVTLGHGAQMTPAVVKKLMVCGQEAYPIRPKGINYVYTPPMFDTIFNLFKAFAKEKMKKRLKLRLKKSLYHWDSLSLQLKIRMCNNKTGYPNDKVIFSTGVLTARMWNKKFFVHGSNLESLYKNVPQRLLPTEYGGQAGPIQDILDTYSRKLDEYAAWFKEDSKCGVDESKRPGKPKTQQELFGLEGSFRQLTVD